MHGAALTVEHLEKVFGRTKVVDDLSFSLSGGELLTLLGPSGSGKTTTIRMIAGFEEPTGGKIELAGKNILDLPVHKRDIGVVFQQYALFPHLTVFRNVAYPLEMRGAKKSAINERVRSALSMVRLTGFEDRFPRQLSGGQQQRVALARAVVFEPRLLLMDEPMGALDKRLRELMQLEVRQLQRQLGITTIAVTHDQVEALVMSDLVAVLDGGKLQQIGPPLEIYQHPANRFVADFIGESNLIQITKVEENDHALTGVSTTGLKTRIGARPNGSPLAASCLVLRPEKIRIGVAAEGLPNHYMARVSDVVHIGDVFKCYVTLETGDNFVVKVLAASGTPCSIGDSVSIGWNPEDCLLVPP